MFPAVICCSSDRNLVSSLFAGKLCMLWNPAPDMKSQALLSVSYVNLYLSLTILSLVFLTCKMGCLSPKIIEGLHELIHVKHLFLLFHR